MLNSSNSVKNICFLQFQQFFDKSQTVFLIVYSINNPVKCFKCHFIGKFRYFSRNCLNSAWIQHEFNTIVMQSVAQSIVKIKVKMKSAWIQHEFDMNSTPLLCKVLRKALWKFKVKIKSAWNQHEFSMNSAWIQHQSDFNYCTKHCEKERVQIIFNAL